MQAKTDKISILIPCFNEEKSIKKCVESCLNQTRKVDEIVVVDDSSTDNSLQILKSFGKRIKVIKIKKRLGNKSYVQEHGLKYVTDSIFIATDGDTVLEKDFVKKIIDQRIKDEPFLETIDTDGFTHKVWIIEDADEIKFIQDKFVKTPVIIADGHHRYITALKRSKQGGCNFIMSMFIDFNDPGLKIYTSYRMIKTMPFKGMDEVINRMKDLFQVSEIGTFDDLINTINKEKKKRSFGLAYDNRYVVFSIDNTVSTEDRISQPYSKEWRYLPVPILHYIIFDKYLDIPKDKVVFKKNLAGIKKLFKEKQFDAVFMVSNTKLEDIERITELGEIMPQKSTYFFPKPLSGLLIHKHREE